jgi:hypothetical protein
MNKVHEVNGYEIDLDRYDEITDPEEIWHFEKNYFNPNTKNTSLTIVLFN